MDGLVARAAAQNPYLATRWSGRSVRLHGTVVAPDGSPVQDAHIQIFTPHMPHNPPTAIVETRSRADGTFELPPVRSGAVDAVVVRGNGGHLTFDRSIDRSARGRVSLGTFVMGPERDVPFVVHCQDELVPEPREARYASMRIAVFQMPADELIVSGYLSARAPDRPLSELPGRESTGFSTFGLEERELRTTIRLPIGEHTVVLGGSCGHSVTTLRVPATGPVTFEQTLPIAGHDSGLEIEIASGSGLPCPARVGVYAQREHQSSSFQAANARVECGQPLRVARLPPTSAEIEIRSRRCEDIPLRPGQTTRVIVSAPGQCRIER